MSLFIGSTFFGMAYYYKNRRLKSLSWVFIALFFTGLIIAKLKHDSLLEERFGVIIKEKVGIRQDPEIQNTEIEYLAEGVIVKVLDEKDGWVYIELPNKLVGWILRPMLKKI